jgi:hypothetical protein
MYFVGANTNLRGKERQIPNAGSPYWRTGAMILLHCFLDKLMAGSG